MAGRRIVLFGATGYTGGLVAGALLRRGQRPVLAGRSPSKLRRLAEEHGDGLEVAAADVADPASVSGLVGRGDVLISTVGPFVRFGDAAAEAALQAGAHYLDSNGEPAFTHRVFERYAPRAAEAGIAMLTAFGWECVLGNVAGAVALREAGNDAVRVDTGYFYSGRVGFSGGTRASWASAIAQPSFAYRDGRLRSVRGAERYRTMSVHGEERPAISFGGSEHFALPSSSPRLLEVNTYQGWFGRIPPRMARLLRAASTPGARALALPGISGMYEATIRRVVRGSTGGPSASERARGRVHVVGIAYDAEGSPITEVQVEGPEGYELTAGLLAWGAHRISAGELEGTGALGPIEAFAINNLEAGFAEAGLQLQSRSGGDP